MFFKVGGRGIACTNEVMSALGCKTVADLQKVDIQKLVEVVMSSIHCEYSLKEMANSCPWML